MRKSFLILLMLVGALPQLTAQQNDTLWVNGVPKVKRRSVEELNPTPMRKDDYVIEISYGYPFVPLREAEAFGVNYLTNTTVYKINRNTNHLCGRVDYQLNDEFSVGLEATYASTQFDYRRTYSIGTYTSITTVDSSYSATVTKFRFLAKMAYHFNLSERFDAYGTLGFGYKQFTFSTADSYLSTTNLLNDVLPLAVRGSVGGRFFVSPNFAVHVEGGVGGPMMQVGLSFKMHSTYVKPTP